MPRWELVVMVSLLIACGQADMPSEAEPSGDAGSGASQAGSDAGVMGAAGSGATPSVTEPMGTAGFFVFPGDPGSEECTRAVLMEVSLGAPAPTMRELDLGASKVDGPWLAQGKLWVTLDGVLHTLEGDTPQPRADIAAEEVMAADLDGDGRAELLVMSEFAWHLFQQDDATPMLAPVPPTRTFPLPAWPAPLPFAIADVDGDGILDLAKVAQATPLVLRGDGAFNFDPITAPPLLDVPWSNSHAAATMVRDINGDGLQDIVALNAPQPFDQGPTSDIFISTHRALDGAGSFVARQVSLPLETPTFGAVVESAIFAEVDDGALVDILFSETRNVWFVPGDEQKLFGTSRLLTTLERGVVRRIHVNDLDADGDLDVLVVGFDLHVASGDGRGGFEVQQITSPAPGHFYQAAPRPPQPGTPTQLIAKLDGLPCE